jgi:oxygen-dependent protoporphyrinogen oxidase
VTVPAKQVVIVGGGITGLSAALSLHDAAAAARLPVSCTLIEGTRAWGGKIATRHAGDFIIETGPDSFLSQKPGGLELCAKLGLTGELIDTNEAHRKTFVFSRGRLRELPEGLVVIVPTKLGPFLRSGLVSWPGMARMALDLVLPARREEADESLAAFFTRRLGREAFERVVEPLMAGIYAGDAEQMSLLATFPRFRELERTHGSLIRGMLASRSGESGAGSSIKPSRPRHTLFVTLRGGLGQLVDALVARLTAAGVILQAGRRVTSLRRVGQDSSASRFELGLDDGARFTADAVILTTPAFAAADLLRPFERAAADLLAGIPYASTGTVSLIYDRARLGASVEGFGFVVPRVERRPLLAATWSSLKWPHRAPPGQALLRCYIGGSGREELLQADDATIVATVRQELQDMAGIEVKPERAEVSRWIRGMPQYVLGHLQRVEQIQVAVHRHPGLFLAGAGYRGIGIPDCIRDGGQAAAGAVRYLSRARA